MGLHNDQDEAHDSHSNEATGESSQAATQGKPSDAQIERELLVSGLIYPAMGDEDGVEIHRGMKILTSEGESAGVVAGVLHNRTPYHADYILLSRLSQQLEYRLVPVELIQQVSKENVLLHVAAPVVNTLRRWHN
jgi:hypothetical protein